MKILYAEDNEDLRDLFLTKLELTSQKEVVGVESGNAALEVLKKDKEIAVVISDYTMPEGDGAFLYKNVRKDFPNLPFILFSGIDLDDVEDLKTLLKDHPQNGMINKPPKPGELETILNKVFEGATQATPVGTDAVVPNTQVYRAVKIKFFVNMNSAPVDAYIRLSDEKYVKVIKTDEPYSSEQIMRYSEKGVKELFVAETDLAKFNNYCLDSMVKILMAKDMKEETVVEVQARVHEMVHNQLSKIGIDEHTMEMMKGSIETSIRVIDSTPSLTDLLKKVMKEGGYIYQHSLFISHLAGAILKKVDWGSDDTKMKVMTAAFLHDTAFLDHELAKRSDLMTEDFKNLNPKEWEIILNHPTKASEMTKGLRNFPPDIDAIIAQHHELPDGTGYPRQLSSLRVAPLAAVFNLTHHFVNAVYRDGFTTETRDKCLKEMSEKFNTGNYKKPLDGILKVFREDLIKF